MSQSQLHTILGAGQIGTLVKDRLLQQGTRVRMVRRGKPGAAQPGLEWASGDITDPAFVTHVTRGASVVYDCTNPGYDQWDALLLPLGLATVHGAAKAGAKLVILDNLYMYGRPNGPMTEDSPLVPSSKKGELRVRLAEARDAAHRRGDVRITTGRASDFFGPGTERASVFGDRFFQRVLAGKSAECLGDPDMLHSYSYSTDVADGLVTLGARDEALGKVWHLPVPPAESTRSMIDRFARAFGMKIGVSRVPRLILRALGVFQPLMREIAEMTYQWEAPFVLDDSRFRAAFGGAVTDVEEGVESTVAWARTRYAARSAA